MTRARCDVNDDNVADAGDSDDDDDDDDDAEASSTTDAMTRCVTALNWSMVADTDATLAVSCGPCGGGGGWWWPGRPFCRLEPLARRDHTDPRHCCGCTLRNRSWRTATEAWRSRRKTNENRSYSSYAFSVTLHEKTSLCHITKFSAKWSPLGQISEQRSTAVWLLLPFK